MLRQPLLPLGAAAGTARHAPNHAMHTTLAGVPFRQANRRVLTRVRREGGFRSTMWVSAGVARKHALQRAPGAAPAARLTVGNRDVAFYNADQLISLARTATGAMWPPGLHRALHGLRRAHRFESDVWFDARALATLRPIDGARPCAVPPLGDELRPHAVFNAEQIAPPARVHTLQSRSGCAPPRAAADTRVLEHVASSRGFTSTHWVSTRAVGLRPGVLPAAALAGEPRPDCVYNTDQLQWPLAAPDPPHTWRGAALLPHEQQVLDRAAAAGGFSSRRWFSVATAPATCATGRGAAVKLMLSDGDTVRLFNECQLQSDAGASPAVGHALPIR
jgi:hypothetical protein